MIAKRDRKATLRIGPVTCMFPLHPRSSCPIRADCPSRHRARTAPHRSSQLKLHGADLQVRLAPPLSCIKFFVVTRSSHAALTCSFNLLRLVMHNAG